MRIKLNNPNVNVIKTLSKVSNQKTINQIANLQNQISSPYGFGHRSISLHVYLHIIHPRLKLYRQIVVFSKQRKVMQLTGDPWFPSFPGCPGAPAWP